MKIHICYNVERNNTCIQIRIVNKGGINLFIASTAITLLFTGIAGYLGKLKIQNSKDFIFGGNKLGVAGVTSMLMGSIIGGASTVGTAQMAFTQGISAIWFIMGVCIASIILGLIYGKYIENKEVETIPQIIGYSYGNSARTASSILLSIGMFIHINGQVIAVIAIFTAVLGMSFEKAAGIVIVLLIVYVVFGGMWSSAIVGGIKTILLYGTSLISGYILIHNLDALLEINSFFPKEPWFNLFSDGVGQDLALGVSTITGILSTQTYFQAVMAGRNKKISRNSGFLTAFLVLPVGIVCTLIGMYMRIHHPYIPPREAFPLFLMEYLSPAIGGISMATVLISSTATGAGLTLGIATMFVRDVYKKIIDKDANDKRQLLILRLVIVLIGIFTFIVVINNKGSLILEWGFLSMVFRALPIFIPVMGAILFKERINPKAGIYSIIGGPVASILWIALGYDKLNSIYIGLLVGILPICIKGHSQRITNS